MSPVVVFTLQEAEAQASDLHAKISAHESFLSGYEQEMDEAVRADVRASSPQTVKRIAALHERRRKADAELPEMRRRHRALSVLADEEQARLAEEEKARRLVELEKYRQAEETAFEKWGEAFHGLWEPYQELRQAIETLHSQWRSLDGGEYCQLHALNPLPADFTSLVTKSVIALVLGTEFASHSPMSKFVEFAERDHAMTLGGGVDLS